MATGHRARAGGLLQPLAHEKAAIEGAAQDERDSRHEQEQGREQKTA